MTSKNENLHSTIILNPKKPNKKPVKHYTFQYPDPDYKNEGSYIRSACGKLIHWKRIVYTRRQATCKLCKKAQEPR